MRAISTIVFAVAASAYVAFGAGQTTPPPQEPAKPVFANGCVSCHIQTPDGDHRLNKVLADMPHVSISLVKSVPGDCLKCHKAQKPAFSQLIHMKHFGKGEKSIFNTMFKGDCTHCHEMDGKTGLVKVKSGPKNW